MSVNSDSTPTAIIPNAEGKYVIFYDLPCENRVAFEDNATAQKRVQCARWKAGELLHGLGIECTQSTIFVAPTKNLQILDVADQVNGIYRNLTTWLNNTAGVPTEHMEPHMEVVELIGNIQIEQFTRIASRTLQEKIDNAIDRMARLIDEIPSFPEERRRRLTYRLPNETEEWRTIQDMANANGIDTRDINELIRLIQQASQVAHR